jgi:hypothetical protein
MIMVMDKAMACLVDLEAVKEEVVEQVITLHPLELEMLGHTHHLKEMQVDLEQCQINGTIMTAFKDQLLGEEAEVALEL